MDKIKLIFTDLDSTLLKDDKTISEYTLNTINKARANGIKFIPATARALRVLKRMKLLDMIPHDLIISLNGARIYDKDGIAIYEKGATKEQVNKILPILLDKFNDCTFSIEVNDLFYANHNVTSYDSYESEHYYNELDDKPSFLNTRIMIGLNNPKDISKLRAVLPDYMYAHGVEGSTLCRILHKDVSKANAIRYLCELWNISLDEVVVFGDDENDLEMFNLCKHSIAMDNAIDELKDIASEITKSNNEDGVAIWIENNILNK